MSWRRVARVPGDPSHPHPVPGDAPAVSDEVLASALDDLDAGFTPVEILDRYPETASELAPLLQTAYELRMTRWPVMSVGGRVAGRERMHAALAEQKRRKAGFLSPLWRQAGAGLALMLIAGAAFLASPLSPLDFPPRRGHGVTPTVGAPVVVPQPSSTDTALPPTLSPTAAWTATATAMWTPAVTAEPSETPERLMLADDIRTATATATRTATPTRRATRTSTAIPASTATLAATATAQGGGAPGGATPQPSPSPMRSTATVAPSPTFTPGKPSPTVTTRPTEPPEPTLSPTAPSPTPTRTPKPPATPVPTASETPEPTETPQLPVPTRTPKHTPRPSETPGPTRTPRIGNVLSDATELRLTVESRTVQLLQQEAREAIRAARTSVPRWRRP